VDLVHLGKKESSGRLSFGPLLQHGHRSSISCKSLGMDLYNSAMLCPTGLAVSEDTSGRTLHSRQTFTMTERVGGPFTSMAQWMRVTCKPVPSVSALWW